MKIEFDPVKHGSILGIGLFFTFTLGYYNKILGFLAFLATGYLFYLLIKIQEDELGQLSSYIEDLGTSFDSIAKTAIFSMPFALVMTDSKGEILWYNGEFNNLCKIKDLIGKSIYDIFKDYNSSIMESGEKFETDIGVKSYTFYSTILRDEKSKKIDRVFLYGLDETEERKVKRDFLDRSQVMGLVFLDNYDEIRTAHNEADRSIIFAGIDNLISRYFTQYNGFVRKYESDKYIVILDHKNTMDIVEKRFDLLDEVKESIGEDHAIVPTVSIGLGIEGKNPIDSYKKARTAMDVALGRGGDQAVIKKEKDMEYYGGKSRAVEKRTTVRSRVIAHALEQLIDQSDKVFVMGHKNADMDSFGAAIGILAAARMREKTGCLVLGDINPSIEEIVRIFEENEAMPERITGEEAVKEFTDKSLLVIVDTHRSVATEEPRLIPMAEDRLVLLDHHRRGADYIENPTLTYLEPFASSTAELVTEVLEYIDGGELTKLEAEALLAGIMVDTKDFYYQTGVRTFEAAARLKRAGADSLDVKRFFKDGYDTYLAKAGVVKNTRILENNIAVGRLYDKRADGILIAAQSADELLEIRGIDASFVLTETEDSTHISGRSLGNISVQLILEKIGGGGHRTSAGVQLKNVDMDEGERMLSEAISKYNEEDK